MTGRRRTPCWVMVRSVSSTGSSAPTVTGFPSASSPTLTVARVAALGEALHDDVAVSDHALEPVVLAADRQRADVEVAHLLRGVDERVVHGRAGARRWS